MKILYFALGTEETASSRLRVYKIADALRVLGHTVDIKISYADVPPRDYDVIVVQKRQDMHERMQWWIARGGNVVFDIDDPTDALPPFTQMTVGSQRLAEMYPGSIYVPDCLDIDDLQFPKIKHNNQLLRVCWFGLSCNLYNAEPVAAACKKLGMQFVVITDLDGLQDSRLWWDNGVEYIPWSLETVDKSIQSCDLVVCPYITTGRWNEEWIQAKGENRILKAWGLGMPVIGTPIPSYLKHGLQYKATTEEEWTNRLSTLRNKKLRMDDAISGHKRALERTADNVAKLWLDVFAKEIKA